MLQNICIPRHIATTKRGRHATSNVIKYRKKDFFVETALAHDPVTSKLNGESWSFV